MGKILNFIIFWNQDNLKGEDYKNAFAEGPKLRRLLLWDSAILLKYRVYSNKGRTQIGAAAEQWLKKWAAHPKGRCGAY